MSVKVLMDSGSQRTYLSERVVEYLKLKPVNSQNIVIKTFGNNSDEPKKNNEYEFCVQGFGGEKVCLKGFGVPIICSPLNGQRINVVRAQFSFLKNINLADKGAGNSEIDVLTGSDFYWKVVTGKVKQCK